jgi:hypothetical protein
VNRYCKYSAIAAIKAFFFYRNCVKFYLNSRCKLYCDHSFYTLFLIPQHYMRGKRVFVNDYIVQTGTKAFVFTQHPTYSSITRAFSHGFIQILHYTACRQLFRLHAIPWWQRSCRICVGRRRALSRQEYLPLFILYSGFDTAGFSFHMLTVISELLH